jgi:arsenate reductase (thioredoxin)
VITHSPASFERRVTTTELEPKDAARLATALASALQSSQAIYVRKPSDARGLRSLLETRRSGHAAAGGGYRLLTRCEPHSRVPPRDDQSVSEASELSPVAQLHVTRAVDALVDELGDVHSRQTIQRVMDDSVAQLAGRAEVDDFLATLAHRFTRERLKAMGRAHGAEHALPDVLFIGLGDSGRGQIAAALVTLRSEGRVVAHSAGSSAGVQVDPAVVEVMLELAVDLSEAYAKPLSAEILRAADVVVTMGRSVGSVEIPAGTRHVDWRVGDPTGTSVDEARRVREDIDRRVQELLVDLDLQKPPVDSDR